ncbi:hypothetical protein [Endothiovibrio diazotrophicus]
MKPKTPQAMRNLIAQVRSALPLERSVEELCEAGCTVCSPKLLEYLAGELEEWEERLERGEVPTLGDVDRLAKSSRKVYRALAKGGVVPPLEKE